METNLSLTTDITSSHAKRVSHTYRQEVKKCLESLSPKAKEKMKAEVSGARAG